MAISPRHSDTESVTLNDVAAHSGVSYQTVSRVINNHPNVAEKTRARVMESIRILNYRPNQAARSLVTKRSNTLAIIGFGTSFYGPAQMVANITRQAKASDYQVTLASVEKLERDEIASALADLRGQLIDGIIMIAPVISEDLAEISKVMGDIPFVQVDTRRQPGIASVVIEQAYGSRLATEHLLSLGHRQIAEISGPLNWHGAVMRHVSWLETMQEHGLATMMSVQGDWSSESGYRAINDLLNGGAEFSAVVVGNDQMALGVIAGLHERGLRVPEDVSIVGFDDVPESAYYLPALTTVRQDFSALGEQSVDYLLSLIKHPKTPIHQRVLHPELVIRKSTQSIS